MLRQVAILFALRDSVYKSLPACDVYDADRDARTWPGGCPLVAHPPCATWGRLRQFASGGDAEHRLALWAVEQVRQWGGVLEHPAGSTLWPAAGLPSPSDPGASDDYTLGVSQQWWGHEARKDTWLYVHGVPRGALPPLPLVLGEPERVIEGTTTSGRRSRAVTKRSRHATPCAFAEWLVAVARAVRS